MDKLKFGDIVDNPHYKPNSPYRKGIFVERTKRGFYRMTDGKGMFWVVSRDAQDMQKIGSIVGDGHVSRE